MSADDPGRYGSTAPPTPPAVTGEGEGGEVLGEEARQELRDLLGAYVDSGNTGVAADVALFALAPHVAALVAQARADGAAEERRSGAGLIASERLRQVQTEGWTPEHDAEHVRGEMARAAAMYALPPEYRYADVLGAMWPQGWAFKPSPGERLRELAKAGALIAAEIDRITRSTS